MGVLYYSLLVFQTLIFAGLSILCEMLEIDWLSIIFVILTFISFSAPKLVELNDKLKEL